MHDRSPITGGRRSREYWVTPTLASGLRENEEGGSKCECARTFPRKNAILASRFLSSTSKSGKPLALAAPTSGALEHLGSVRATLRLTLAARTSADSGVALGHELRARSRGDDRPAPAPGPDRRVQLKPRTNLRYSSGVMVILGRRIITL